MDPITVIAIGKAIYGWIHNKTQEQKARDEARKRYEDYYNSPALKLANQGLRDRFKEHGVDQALQDSLLSPRPFNMDSDQFKNPGQGTAAIMGVVDALANQYKADQAAKKAAGASEPIRVGSRASDDLYGSVGTMARPGTSGVFGGAGAYPAGTATRLPPSTNFAGSNTYDPQSIFNDIFGPGAAPPAVNDPAHPWDDPLRRFYYPTPTPPPTTFTYPGQPSRPQGL